MRIQKPVRLLGQQARHERGVATLSPLLPGDPGNSAEVVERVSFAVVVPEVVSPGRAVHARSE